MTDPDAPLTTRGVPRTRFDPLRDAPRAKTAELSDRDRILLENGLSEDVSEEEWAENGDTRVLSVVWAVRRQIIALGLAETPEGAMALALAEKSEEAVGSAAAACLHELRMVMADIRASRPVAEVKRDATEDVLARKRERRAGA
jgi:hypothetical protein